jgi:hypothetical protein
LLEEAEQIEPIRSRPVQAACHVGKRSATCARIGHPAPGQDPSRLRCTPCAPPLREFGATEVSSDGA